MNCKKYKACIVGLIVFTLVIGTFAYVHQMKQQEVPEDCVLVQNMTEDEGQVRA